jgi:hypothetical protein
VFRPPFGTQLVDAFTAAVAARVARAPGTTGAQAVGTSSPTIGPGTADGPDRAGDAADPAAEAATSDAEPAGLAEDVPA